MKGILGEVDNTGWSQGSGTSGGLDATVHPVEHMGLAELGQVEGGHRPLGVTNVSGVTGYHLLPGQSCRLLSAGVWVGALHCLRLHWAPAMATVVFVSWCPDIAKDPQRRTGYTGHGRPRPAGSVGQELGGSPVLAPG